MDSKDDTRFIPFSEITKINVNINKYIDFEYIQAIAKYVTSKKNVSRFYGITTQNEYSFYINTSCLSFHYDFCLLATPIIKGYLNCETCINIFEIIFLTFIKLINEPVREKTNNLHMRKQRRRSAVQ